MLKTIQLQQCQHCSATFGRIYPGAKPRRYGHVVEVHRQRAWKPGEVELVIESNCAQGGVQTVTIKTKCDCQEIVPA